MRTILVLNGPNLNMLGTREPGIYGHTTYADIVALCDGAIAARGYKADIRQSNHEGELVTWIQEASLNGTAAVIINPGAYTHTSVAIHDALRLLSCPIAEVHLSDPKKREAFRHVSFVEPVAALSVAGHGAQSYTIAIDGIAERLSTSK